MEYNRTFIFLKDANPSKYVDLNFLIYETGLT